MHCCGAVSCCLGRSGIALGHGMPSFLWHILCLHSCLHRVKWKKTSCMFIGSPCLSATSCHIECLFFFPKSQDILHLTWCKSVFNYWKSKLFIVFKMLIEDGKTEMSVFWLLEDWGRNADKKPIQNKIIYLQSHYGEIGYMCIYILCIASFRFSLWSCHILVIVSKSLNGNYFVRCCICGSWLPLPPPPPQQKILNMATWLWML